MDKTILKTFGKKQEVSVILTRSWCGEAIVRVSVDHTFGPLCDWPHQYDDGSIAYDYPERLSKTRKALVARAYRWIKRNHVPA